MRTANRRGARAEAYARIIDTLDHEIVRMTDDDVKTLLGELVTELEDRLGPESTH